jgi:hypothetical protein
MEHETIEGVQSVHDVRPRHVPLPFWRAASSDMRLPHRVQQFGFEAATLL